MSGSEANPFSAVINWLSGVLLGTIATAVAVIAVASIGLLLITGRIEIRRAIRVIAGCFIIFGAPTIAGGIRYALLRAQPHEAVDVDPPATPIAPAIAPAYPPSASPFEPYAGTRIPPR